MKRLAIIGCMAALGVFAEVPEDWTGTTHDLTTGALMAADGGAYWVTGSGNVITVPANVTCTVALDTVTIDAPAGANPFTVGAGSTVHLQLTGTSTLTGADGWSGLALSASGASLVVDDGDGTLVSTGGKARPGICVPDGAFFTLDASNATVKATGGSKAKTANDAKSSSAAGLGSYGRLDSGTVTINAGRLEARGGSQGAGIGVGSADEYDGATCGDVIVNGGTVVAWTSGWGCGIGGATPYWKAGGNLKSYTQTGGEVRAFGETAAGIGAGGGGKRVSGFNGGWCGPVKITGGRLVADSLTYSHNQDYCVGAGIGGAGVRFDTTGVVTPGKAGYLKSYEQTGGDVTVRGARIGFGGGGVNYYCATNIGTLAYDTAVKVSGGTLTVSTGQYGVYAIGGMENARCDAFIPDPTDEINLKSVTITGGSVKLGGDIQVAPSNMVGEAVFAAPTKMKRIDRAAPPLDVSFAVTNGLGETAYTYAYAGSGHANDENVYFWLPNGSFKIGASGGDMANGVWTPWSGLWIFFR